MWQYMKDEESMVVGIFCHRQPHGRSDLIVEVIISVTSTRSSRVKAVDETFEVHPYGSCVKCQSGLYSRPPEQIWHFQD